MFRLAQKDVANIEEFKSAQDDAAKQNYAERGLCIVFTVHNVDKYEAHR